MLRMSRALDKTTANFGKLVGRLLPRLPGFATFEGGDLTLLTGLISSTRRSGSDPPSGVVYAYAVGAVEVFPAGPQRRQLCRRVFFGSPPLQP
jgi:hypothetical protein